MEFLSFDPCAILKPYVERYIVVDAKFAEGQQHKHFIAPSSTSQLAINCATANTKPDEVGALDRHYVTALVGPFTRRHTYILHGHIYSVVAYFTPIGLHALLNIDLTDLADQTVDFASILPDDALHLSKCVLGAIDNHAKVQVLEAYLLRRLASAKPLNQGVQRAVELIRQQGGQIAIAELLQQLTLQQRTFERHFRQTTGMSPKQFMRITRFLAVRNAIADGTYQNWHDVLHQGGYYDQAHFIREFSLFTGQTPSAYFAGSIGFDNFLLKV
ncbi:helix-turn-helix domain-containing protein [Spirosoma soli]|uniref:Helix-turn-helix domain-containing protein n=1 Tax=Spirosoma soli TaxID=1770529 RepID=A0ABW5MBR4_9BACT